MYKRKTSSDPFISFSPGSGLSCVQCVSMDDSGCTNGGGVPKECTGAHANSAYCLKSVGTVVSGKGKKSHSIFMDTPSLPYFYISQIKLLVLSFYIFNFLGLYHFFAWSIQPISMFSVYKVEFLSRHGMTLTIYLADCFCQIYL